MLLPAHLITDAGMTVALATMAVVLLVVCLALRDLAANAAPRWHDLARILNVAIVPLLMTFFVLIVNITSAFLRQSPPR